MRENGFSDADIEGQFAYEEFFDRMRRSGLLLTEFVPGERPLAGNFPRRNRLIAALSEAVVVVEMGVKSGAQHTVNFALDQGKEVLAVPVAIDSPQSEGTNQLIRDGARAADALVPEVSGALFATEDLRGAVGSFLADGPGKASYTGR